MGKNLDFKDRIQQIMSFYKLNAGGMAERVGCSRSTMYNLESGLTKPDYKTCERILAEFPEISAEWFMRGHGPMMRRSLSEEVEVQVLEQKIKALEGLYKGALLGKPKGEVSRLGKGPKKPIEKNEFIAGSAANVARSYNRFRGNP